MIFLLILLLVVIPSCSFAEICSKSPDQAQLEQALSGDVRGYYYRDNYDYNAFAPAENNYALIKD